MTLYECRPDLPSKWDDYTEPEWTNRIISYYRNSYIIPRKTAESFLHEISELLDLEEIQATDLTEDEIRRVKIIQEENTEYTKIWTVRRNRKSELYYRYLYAHYPYDSEFVSIYYRKEMNVFRSSCTLLDCRMRMIRGVDQEDIDRNTNEYVDYYMAFFGYNSCLSEICSTLDQPVIVHDSADPEKMIKVEFEQ